MSEAELAGGDEALDETGAELTGGIKENTREAIGILSVSNYLPYSFLHAADVVGLPSTAAANIVRYRLGPDGVVSTGDDEQFETLAELDAIPYVGPAAFAKLLAYAQRNGLVPAPSLDPCWSATLFPDSVPAHSSPKPSHPGSWAVWYPQDQFTPLGRQTNQLFDSRADAAGFQTWLSNRGSGGAIVAPKKFTGECQDRTKTVVSWRSGQAILALWDTTSVYLGANESVTLNTWQIDGDRLKQLVDAGLVTALKL